MKRVYILIGCWLLHFVALGQCINDTIGPTIHLNTMDTVFHAVNAPYRPVEVFVTDNCTPDSQIDLKRTSNCNPYILGKFWDQYVAVDSSMNITSKRRWIIVEDTTRPVIIDKHEKLHAFHHPDSFYDPLSFIKILDNHDAPSELFQNLVILYSNVKPKVIGSYSIIFQTHDNSNNFSDPFTLALFVQEHPWEIPDTPNSVEPQLQNGVSQVYPNPATQILTIKSSNNLTGVEVFGLKGNLINLDVDSTTNFHQLNLDVSSLTPGIYILVLSHPTYSERRRIVVEQRN